MATPSDPDWGAAVEGADPMSNSGIGSGWGDSEIVVLSSRVILISTDAVSCVFAAGWGVGSGAGAVSITVGAIGGVAAGAGGAGEMGAKLEATEGGGVGGFLLPRPKDFRLRSRVTLGMAAPVAVPSSTVNVGFSSLGSLSLAMILSYYL